MTEMKMVPVEPGKVYVEVLGLTGTGKSAVMGEIEIAMKALGLTVEHDAKFQAEKNATHADWQDALDLYKPTVVISERNVSRASPQAPAREGVDRIDWRTQDAIAGALHSVLPLDVDWQHIRIAGRAFVECLAALTSREEAPAEGAGEWINGTAENPVGTPVWCAWATNEIMNLRARTSEPEAGAVAWRRRVLQSGTGPGSEWVLYGRDDGDYYAKATDRYEIEPLYTHPAPAPADKLKVAVERLAAIPVGVSAKDEAPVAHCVYFTGKEGPPITAGEVRSARQALAALNEQPQ